MKRRKFVGVDGYCYSSIHNFKIIKSFFDIGNTYEKYVLIIKRVFQFMKKRRIQKDNKRNRRNIFSQFRTRIEKFCMLNFQTVDFSFFHDIFNRIMVDIYYRLKMI